MTNLQAGYLVLTALLTGFYLWNNLRYFYWWRKIPVWNIPKSYQPHTSVSILIPARNEAANIGPCLKSILNQQFPAHLMEVIVLDDFSDDATPEIVQGIEDKRVRYLRLADFAKEKDLWAHKKKGIEIGIQHAQGELIITTDADCWLPPNWLVLLVSYYQSQRPVFIAAPVNFTNEKNALERFQSLDFTGMMLLTGAGIQGQFMHMCNGANLAYTKKVFDEVGGFSGINHLASGDDMLLLQKIAQHYPDRIGFLKNREATALTTAQPTWKAFFNQRVRWASKSAAYREWGITVTLGLVFAFCVNIFFSLLAGLWWGSFALLLFAGQLLLKSIADFVMLRKATHFFGRIDLLRTFPRSQLYHIFYIAVIGFWANATSEYEWKNRRVR